MGKFCAVGGGSEPIKINFKVKDPPKKEHVMKAVRRVTKRDIDVDVTHYDGGELTLKARTNARSWNSLPKALMVVTRLILAAAS